MEPSSAQTKRIKYLTKAFGKGVIKPHAPDPKTGILRVEAESMAGVHQWYFDADGCLVDRSITQRLFDPPQPTHRARNALDN